MRLLVSGARDYANKVHVKKVLDELQPTVIIHGNCRRGVDQIADQYAIENGIPCIKMDANWSYHGKSAGPIRNQWMLDHCSPDKVVAFPTEKSRGTRDMITAAKKAGLEPIVYEV